MVMLLSYLIFLLEEEKTLFFLLFCSAQHVSAFRSWAAHELYDDKGFWKVHTGLAKTAKNWILLSTLGIFIKDVEMVGIKNILKLSHDNKICWFDFKISSFLPWPKWSRPASVAKESRFGKPTSFNSCRPSQKGFRPR